MIQIQWKLYFHSHPNCNKLIYKILLFCDEKSKLLFSFIHDNSIYITWSLGYTGTRCETDIDYCEVDNRCQNGAVCQDGEQGFR